MPIPAAGNFDNTALLKVRAKMDEVWLNPIARAEYIPHCETALALYNEQAGNQNFRILEGMQDNTVRVEWLNSCGQTTSNLTDDCTIGGAEASSDSKDYVLNLKQTTGFSVKEKMGRAGTFTMEDVVAIKTLNSIKLLDEWWNKQAIAALEANRGTNAYLASGWANASGDTTVPTAAYTKALIPKLIMAGIKNRFNDMYMITGDSLWEEAWEAAINQANAEGKGDAARMQQIRRYHDLYWLDTQNSPNEKFYLVNRGALAITTKAYYGSMLKTYKDHDRYSVASRTLPGVVYDVRYKNRCVSNEVWHDFSFDTYGGIFLNPMGCTESRTGVLAFKKVA